MGSDELAIIDYLKQFPRTFVTVTDICKRAANKRRYARDPEWARPVLRRLEADGHLDSNQYGHYKLKDELIIKYTQASKKMERDERCRNVLTSHILNMPPEDDEKTFSTLIREALSTDYAEEIGLSEQGQEPEHQS
jgi:hypothetical protein